MCEEEKEDKVSHNNNYPAITAYHVVRFMVARLCSSTDGNGCAVNRNVFAQCLRIVYSAPSNLVRLKARRKREESRGLQLAVDPEVLARGKVITEASRAQLEKFKQHFNHRSWQHWRLEFHLSRHVQAILSRRRPLSVQGLCTYIVPSGSFSRPRLTSQCESSFNAPFQLSRA